jgi:hypothetical protein
VLRWPGPGEAGGERDRAVVFEDQLRHLADLACQRPGRAVTVFQQQQVVLASHAPQAGLFGPGAAQLFEHDTPALIVDGADHSCPRSVAQQLLLGVGHPEILVGLFARLR